METEEFWVEKTRLGGGGSSEAPCGGAANSEAEEAQEVGGTQHQPRREALRKMWKIHGEKPPEKTDFSHGK